MREPLAGYTGKRRTLRHKLLSGIELIESSNSRVLACSPLGFLSLCTISLNLKVQARVSPRENLREESVRWKLTNNPKCRRRSGGSGRSIRAAPRHGGRARTDRVGTYAIHRIFLKEIFV